MTKLGTSRGIWLFIGLLSLLLAMVFTGTEIFQVDKISVLGSKTVDIDAIIRVSGIRIGDNIFKVSRHAVKNRIEGTPPYLKVESVTLKMPDKVIIRVKERTPLAVIPYLSSDIVIDAEGFVLDIQKRTDEPMHPSVLGLRITGLTRGHPLSVSETDPYKLRRLLKLLAALEETQTADTILTIDLRETEDIVLITREGYPVYLGQALDLTRKLTWLRSDGYQQVLSQNRWGELDIRQAGTMIFRPMKPVDEVEH